CTSLGVPLEDMLLSHTYLFVCPADVPQSFKIICSVDQPPNTPSNPNPSNQSTDVLLNTDLSWTGGDPDSGDTVTYDVFFGTSTSPPKVASNISATSYDPGTMEYFTRYYWRIIAWDNHDMSAKGPLWWFITEQNKPPELGSPTPSNGSTNQPLSLTWSIPISDPEGDTFSWTIQCSNGQQNSGTGASNGTKSLALTGLAPSTTYKVWVNATDPGGSGLFTRGWYKFTTKADQPPVFGSPNPSNGSTNNPRSFTWSIPINDSEGDTFSWSIQCSNGQTNGGSGATNGTKSLALSGLAYSTTYKVWVNATDPGGSGRYTRKWYTFTTKASQPPVFGTPSPANGSTGNPLSFSWSISISDPEGDSIDWTIQCSNGQTSGATDDSNGTKSLSLSGLAYNTMYKVWVNATDPDGSGLYTKKWYVFTTTTKPNQPPNVPSNPDPYNGSVNVNVTTALSWTGGDPDQGDSVTYDVYFGTTNPPALVHSNQSTTSYDPPGSLQYLTKYYWRVVAWDDHGASTQGPLWDFTTEVQLDNTPPTMTLSQPQSGILYLNIADKILLRFPFIMTVVIGKINVMVAASDTQSGVNRVEFWVDDVCKCTDDTAPYNWTWSEIGLFQRTLKVVAYDNAGNQNSVSLILWKIQLR
ncbi:MAG TPA: Ig-like domain-containing protein, partial [Candidatus Thermoplasmatota archaeon]|nr:Ig-like domain-containing protein [Candidatus Thermoplasmatota archaeon]